ncbi:class I SAM-dependent methyltransferase [Phenylobacterium sp. CCH12-B4]|uniref:class I SAM-dependent methyltransferase n=1 Tax=Phenylobacterium sp. CCH12-B4 TaxID=1768784 RepID=UPI001E590258|nr:class I SAM-dependent methyltransferase [Phenylobacterium sp. CCH12-B4]
MSPLRIGADAAQLAVLRRAVEAFNAGRWAEAEALARQVLARQPADPSALNVLGGAAMNTGRHQEAIPFLERAARGQPRNPFIAFNLAEALRRSGNAAAALRAFRHAIQLKPDFAEAHAHAGDACRALGRSDEAEAAYRRALALRPGLPTALMGLGVVARKAGDLESAARFLGDARDALLGQPGRAAACSQLGVVLLDLGHRPEALAAFDEAVRLAPEVPDYWRLLARGLRDSKVAPEGAAFRDTLLALFARPDVNPRGLATAALVVLKRNPAFAGLLDAIAADPAGVDGIIAERRASAVALLADRVFQTLMVAAPIPDVAVEQLLTSLRRDVLLQAAEAPSESATEDLDLICALAQQCWLNEYVYFVTPAEQAALEALRAALAQRDDDERRWGAVALIGCYMRLDQALGAANLPADPPASLQAVLRQQIEEPRAERELAAGLRSLRPVQDRTSRAVQAQYEENPYPRWTRCGQGEPAALRDVVAAALPHLPSREPPTVASPRVLVAGCGTGLETMRVVTAYRGASVVALDLSRASLAYGARKLAEYGVENVQLVHGDILDVARLGEEFDLIESFGVVHHMADPERGLAELRTVLKRGGLMRLGLYSELGRAGVVAARGRIAARGYAPDASGVRQLRREIMTESDLAPDLRGLLSPVSDFWTTSDCRDLLFHVQEHRFGLLQIDEMISRLGLTFLGMEPRHGADLQRFRGEYPAASSLRSLRDWHAFEQRHPETFGETYRFWLRRD